VCFVVGASFAACLPWPATDDDSGGSDSTRAKEDREAEKLAHGDLIYRLEGYQSVNEQRSSTNPKITLARKNPVKTTLCCLELEMMVSYRYYLICCAEHCKVPILNTSGMYLCIGELSLLQSRPQLPLSHMAGLPAAGSKGSGVLVLVILALLGFPLGDSTGIPKAAHGRCGATCEAKRQPGTLPSEQRVLMLP
jgi:hypothetical protein